MDLEAIKNLIETRINELGYSLYSLRNRKEGKDLILEVIVDRVEPISMNDIVSLTDEINKLLDESDPIEEGYVLDVSSLGAEKPLKVEDLPLYKGSYIHLHLLNPILGENIYEGTLEEVNDEELVLSFMVKTRKKSVNIPLSNINKVRLAIKF